MNFYFPICFNIQERLLQIPTDYHFQQDANHLPSTLIRETKLVFESRHLSLHLVL